MTPTVSVVICTHSDARFEQLVDAINSVTNQSLGAFEVLLVIDNNKSLFERAEQVFANVVCIENNRTKGLSGARNTGVLQAQGSIIAFLDDDAVADHEWLKTISEKFESQFVVGVGGPITPVWPNRRPSWLPTQFDWVVGCTYAGLHIDAGKVRNLIGCNMSFRRSALLMAGMFSENLGRVGSNAAGAEETELCLRINAIFPSAYIAHEDGVRVNHQIEQGRTKFDYFSKRCWAEGKSKALMVGHSSKKSGLASERRQLFTVLPGAVWNYLKDGITGADKYGLQRAAATVVGSGLVVGGYIKSQLFSHRASGATKPFFPIRVCNVDLNQPLEEISASNNQNERPYASAHLVVRQHGHLLAVVDVPMFGENIKPQALTRALAEIVPEVVLDKKQKTTPSNSVENLLPTRVIVATRDRPKMLANCLDSLLEQDHPNFEIIVVDNAPSSDATKRMISEKYGKISSINYVLEARPGLANAHNRGLDNLGVPIVAFTDDDVIADKSWLSTLTRPFLHDQNIGCVTGGIVPAELETRAQFWTEKHGGFLKSTDPMLFDLAENRPNNSLFPYAAGMMGSGANMAFKAEALNKIDWFNTALGAGTLARGGDDLAAFSSVILAGYKLSYVPDALVWHFHRRSDEGMKRQAFGYGVGLGAYLTSCISNNPAVVLKFASAAPAAAIHLLGRKSDKNERLPDDYPTSYIWSERLGIIAGVPSYLKSVWANKSLERKGQQPRSLKSAWDES